MSEPLVAPLARADLFAQWDYFSDVAGDPDLADRFVACAERTFRILHQTPGLGRPRRFRSPQAQGLRSWGVSDFRNYLIFYRLLKEADGVEIVRVLHGARDIKTLFEG